MSMRIPMTTANSSPDSPISHDHIFRCSCGYEIVLNDCPCNTPVTYRKCWPCKEQQAYKETERRRNKDY